MRLIVREVSALKARKAGIFTKIVIAALMVYAIVTLIKLQDRIEEAEIARDALTVQARELQAGNAGLEHEVSHSTDRETLEDVARNKLGFVLPGEIVFYNLND